MDGGPVIANQRGTRRTAQRTAVVIGGGIGGLSAARALQQAGWSVQVLEQAPQVEPLGAGISLWPNALLALDVLNVPRPAHTPSTGVSGIRTSSGRLLSRTDPDSFAARFGAPLITVHRADLHESLLTSLLPRTVITGARVTRVERHASRVTVQHTHGPSSADLAVLADGLASSTRHLVAGSRPRVSYAGYTAWRGVTDFGAGLSPLHATGESWGRGQRFGLLPLTDGRVYWFATANTAEGQRASDSEHTEVLRRFAGWHAPIGRVVQATDPTAVLRHDVYDVRPAPSSYVKGRLLLLGDAAHAMTPNLGQGACQTLEDAATLGALVRPGAELDSALRRYDASRRPRAELIARRSRQLGRIGQLQGVGSTTVRNLLMRAKPHQLSDRQLAETLRWQPPAPSPQPPATSDRRLSGAPLPDCTP